MVRIGSYRAVALYDTVLNVGVITDVNIIKNDRILDRTVVADVCLLEYYGVLDHAVYDTSRRNERITNLRTVVVFSRRQIVNL